MTRYLDRDLGLTPFDVHKRDVRQNNSSDLARFVTVSGSDTIIEFNARIQNLSILPLLLFISLNRQSFYTTESIYGTDVKTCFAISEFPPWYVRGNGISTN